MKIEELIKEYEIVQGDFNNLNRFDFEGVYIIYEPKTREIVYVGSAYARKISERLKQYKQKDDTGNTLMHAICKKEYNVDKVKKIKNKEKNNAMKIIDSLEIYAIPHRDLEYELINKCQPIYNTAGVQLDYTT